MTRGFLRFLRGNTIALLALFLALGGTTYAAVSLPANSVGAKQLKKNAVINKKIKANAVTGAKVKNDSLTGADVVEGSLGKVPSAANADHATTNATNGDHAQRTRMPSVGSGRMAIRRCPRLTAALHDWAACSTSTRMAPRETKTFTGPSGSVRTASLGRLNGAVNLPQGVTVTSLRLDYLDDSGTFGLQRDMLLDEDAAVRRGGTYTDIYAATLPNTATPGAVGSGTDTTPSVAGSNVIDNTKYNYTIIIQDISRPAPSRAARTSPTPFHPVSQPQVTPARPRDRPLRRQPGALGRREQVLT